MAFFCSAENCWAEAECLLAYAGPPKGGGKIRRGERIFHRNYQGNKTAKMGFSLWPKPCFLGGWDSRPQWIGQEGMNRGREMRSPTWTETGSRQSLTLRQPGGLPKRRSMAFRPRLATG